MRIQAEWRDCTPKLLGEQPRICREGVRRLKLRLLDKDGTARIVGHQHLILKGLLPNFIHGDADDWGSA